mgnify:CR=1 FL=1
MFKGPSKLQLYNLNDDPKELNDLASNYPEIVEKMEISMKEAHTEAEIQTAIENSRFSKVRKAEDQQADQSARIFRKGQVGEWRQIFDHNLR